MADVVTNVNCGCGYHTKRLEEAVKHSDRTNHRMTILGTVTPTPVKVAESAVVSNTKPLDELATTAEKVGSFDTLRERITGGKK